MASSGGRYFSCSNTPPPIARPRLITAFGCRFSCCQHRYAPSGRIRRRQVIGRFFKPLCLLASLGAEELRIGGAGCGSTDGVGGLCVHAGGLVWWLEICPSVSPRRRNSGVLAGHKGTTASRSSKRSKAQRRDRVRTVGASLHPWGLTGCRYASERGEPTGGSAAPSTRPHRPGYHPGNDAREASQLSHLPPRRSALQPAQRRLEAERNALGLPFGVKASAEAVSRAWATRVQREADQARVVPA